MTPSEQKIFEAIMDLAKEQATFNADFKNLSETVKEHGKYIDTLRGDRKFVIGASWLGGGLLGLGSLIYELFKHS